MSLRPPDLGLIDLATGFLLRNCGSDGQFVYRINLDPESTVKPKYNMLRHAGALYALAEAVPRDPDPARCDAVRRAARFLVDVAVAEVPESGDLLAVWSPPGLTRSKRPLQAKLGGSGLGLLALTTLESAVPGSVPENVFAPLARFICFMQKEDGSFYSKYVPEQGGRRDRWTSLYYPGEAALGLVRLFERDGNSQWRDAAARALAYLARSRAGDESVPADHWALLATARLLEQTNGTDRSVERGVLIAHAVQVCESILREQVWETDQPAFVGGFASDGRTTPTATRLEGMLAALTFLPDADPELALRLRSSIDSAMGFLLPAILTDGPHAGGVPRAVMRFADDDPRNVRSFNRRATEVRIDYVQHALSAMMQYERLFGGLPRVADHRRSA
ncbi:MAG: hypothetical protein HKO59_15450 [Phycisphaerales bacterium]|nr:hypothetical protein [Phycisphaerales bacterium]NNM27353.1 hypothetical protein [Phycisphaerales bacterium]